MEYLAEMLCKPVASVLCWYNHYKEQIPLMAETPVSHQICHGQTIHNIFGIVPLSGASKIPLTSIELCQPYGISFYFFYKKFGIPFKKYLAFPLIEGAYISSGFALNHHLNVHGIVIYSGTG